jgi:hypothetical protein
LPSGTAAAAPKAILRWLSGPLKLPRRSRRHALGALATNRVPRPGREKLLRAGGRSGRGARSRRRGGCRGRHTRTRHTRTRHTRTRHRRTGHTITVGGSSGSGRCCGGPRRSGHAHAGALFGFNLGVDVALGAVSAENRAHHEPENQPNEDRRDEGEDRIGPKFFWHRISLTRRVRGCLSASRPRPATASPRGRCS